MQHMPIRKGPPTSQERYLSGGGNVQEISWRRGGRDETRTQYLRPLVNEFADTESTQSVPLLNFENIGNGFVRRFSRTARARSLRDTLEGLFDHFFRGLGHTAGKLLVYKLFGVRR